ncbi:AraC family transcriptional regulator [Pseudoalteromonas sp.]|uniref:AraC family transcriptional regulator n=1 Tax=Pseudoalteromonas sp. TaxID=53249 RepID=UPI003565236C
MRAFCEKVITPTDASWRYHKYLMPYMPFSWHYHPEYEICLTLNSKGMRHIGDHIEEYGDLDLVFVGPNLPHTWQSESNKDGTEQIVYVAQIPVKWLDKLVRDHKELQGMMSLLARSLKGIKFSEVCASSAKTLFEQMENASVTQRLILLLELLSVMQQDCEQQTLSSPMFAFGKQMEKDNGKLNQVIEFIYAHYTESLYADQLAELAHMSTNHFHRYFKQRTETTLTEFINRLRIGKACKLLVTSTSPISVISDQCGFNNVSNFNRRFLAIKGCTPRKFRQQLINHNLIS